MRPLSDWELVSIVLVLIAWGLLWGLGKIADLLFAPLDRLDEIISRRLTRWERLRKKRPDY